MFISSITIHSRVTVKKKKPAEASLLQYCIYILRRSKIAQRVASARFAVLIPFQAYITSAMAITP